VRVGHLIVLAPLAIGCADADKAPECREGTRLAANGACEPVVDTGSGEPSEHPGTGDDTASADDSGTAASPSDSGIFVVEPPPASWNLEEVGVAFDGLMATGVPDPWTVYAAWRDMFGGADWLCPGDGYNISSGAEGCISEDGWRYAGLARYEEIDADGEVTRRP
jgi:hypothetical protein